MTWVRSDDRKPLNRKIRPLSDAAYRLDDHALHYCARHETDGLIYLADFEEIFLGIKRKTRGPLISECVDAGLWHERGAQCGSAYCPAHLREIPVGAWAKHDYLLYNKSHAELESIREADRKRKRNPPRNPDGIQSDSTSDSGDPVPSRPVQPSTDRDEIPSVGSPLRPNGWLADQMTPLSETLKVVSHTARRRGTA